MSDFSCAVCGKGLKIRDYTYHVSREYTDYDNTVTRLDDKQDAYSLNPDRGALVKAYESLVRAAGEAGFENVKRDVEEKVAGSEYQSIVLDKKRKDAEKVIKDKVKIFSEKISNIWSIDAPCLDAVLSRALSVREKKFVVDNDVKKFLAGEADLTYAALFTVFKNILSGFETVDSAKTITIGIKHFSE